MCERSRAQRFAISFNPSVIHTFAHERRAWHETPEEIEEGLQWGEEKAALLKWVRRQIGRRLTARERRCVELYFFEGLTYREVGEKTGTHQSSAFRAIKRAVRKLKASADKGEGRLRASMPKVPRFRKRE